MARNFKFLILLVALVALPLRGVAAVAMWHCAQDRHEMTAPAQGHGLARGEHAAHSDHAHSDHAHSDHAHSDHAHSGPDHEAPAESQGSPNSSSCSACAACCAGGAVAPTAWSSLSLELPGASAIAFVERSFKGVVPAQLERPPLVRSV